MVKNEAEYTFIVVGGNYALMYDPHVTLLQVLYVETKIYNCYVI